MSPIGRIFIVLNLVLAGVFVGFASTYLQSAADYKSELNTAVEEHTKAKEDLDAQLLAKSTEANGLKNKLSQINQLLKSEQTKTEGLTDENERLDKQLADVQAKLGNIDGSLAQVSTTVESSTREFTESTKAALTALQERDQAVRSQSVAEADLADARNMIASLNDKIGGMEINLADASRKIGEQRLLLDVAKSKGLFEGVNTVTPSLTGTVLNVGPNGKLVTINVTDNPAGAELRKGYEFAVTSGRDYKGEARVTEIDGSTVFCTMVIEKQGAPRVQVGDAAMTHLK